MTRGLMELINHHHLVLGGEVIKQLIEALGVVVKTNITNKKHIELGLKSQEPSLNMRVLNNLTPCGTHLG
jgi:hypothetical protein